MLALGILRLRYSIKTSSSFDFPLRLIPVITLISGVFMEFISF